MSARPVPQRRSRWPTIGFGVFVVIVGSQLWVLSTTQWGAPRKPSIAQLQCVHLAKAIEVYRDLPENKREALPAAPRELHQPPWGGPSLLENGEADLIDPWGKPYVFEYRTRADGTKFILVRTTVPDGTPITQYGIGPNSEPK